MVCLAPVPPASISFGNFLVTRKPLATSLSPPKLHCWTIYFLKHFINHLQHTQTHLNKLQIEQEQKSYTECEEGPLHVQP